MIYQNNGVGVPRLWSSAYWNEPNGNQCIGLAGPEPWPPKSPDFTLFYFTLWCVMKDIYIRPKYRRECNCCIRTGTRRNGATEITSRIATRCMEHRLVYHLCTGIWNFWWEASNILYLLQRWCKCAFIMKHFRRNDANCSDISRLNCMLFNIFFRHVEMLAKSGNWVYLYVINKEN
jgi:hypothetical protein